MNAQFVNALFRVIKSKSGTSNVDVTLQQERRPILKTALLHTCNLVHKPRLHYLWIEGAANQRTHFRIAPESHRQRQIFIAPTSKAKMLGSQKIVHV